MVLRLESVQIEAIHVVRDVVHFGFLATIADDVVRIEAVVLIVQDSSLQIQNPRYTKSTFD